MDEIDDKLLLATFYNRVNSDLFIHKLYEQEPQTMAELIHSAQNFMNAEDAIIAKKRKRAEQCMEADLPRHFKQGPCPKKAWTGEKKDRDNKKAGSSAWSQQYTPLEHTSWTSAYANQGLSFLEVDGKNEGRSQQTQ